MGVGTVKISYRGLVSLWPHWFMGRLRWLVALGAGSCLTPPSTSRLVSKFLRVEERVEGEGRPNAGNVQSKYSSLHPFLKKKKLPFGTRLVAR